MRWPPPLGTSQSPASRRGPAHGRSVAILFVLAFSFGAGVGRGGDATLAEANGSNSKRLPDPALPGLDAADPGLMAKLAKALSEKGAGYRPRTRHRKADGTPQYTNRLILETSPYLLQHAQNPVNWFPWGDEAFERARVAGKPVFLSVGYSTCHWCHVMEEESFEDEELAGFLNEHFVAIKVDREERPDLDALYMNAVQALAGRGGWPMTAALTPAREPFFGGTYFPPRDGDRGARKGLLTILRELSDLYQQNPERAVAIARQVTAQIGAAAAPVSAGGLAGPAAIRNAAESLAKSFDPVHGGFGAAPKFPTPSNLELLARYFRRTNDPQALHIVVLTLEKMAAGGIYDQVGGGFHRYSTDATWLVPHFEKMLYDNAQLVAVYLEGYQLTGRRDFARVARETLDYVDREMSDPLGGFYSATDADSPVPGKDHAAEGWYFTWTPAELTGVLEPGSARNFGAFYGVTERGNFDGRNILHAAAERPAEIDAARRALYQARLQRPPPFRDEKVIASWNGLMISAFARGAAVLGEPRFAARALKAANFISSRMKAGDTLHRTFREGRAKGDAVLDDYAFMAQGFLDLYETTHDVRWLSAASALHRALKAGFWDARQGGFYLTSADHEALLVREKPDDDGAEPSGNSVAALNLLRLAEWTGDARQRETAEGVFRAFESSLRRGAGATKMLCALDFALDKPAEIVLVASTKGGAAGFDAVLGRTFLPNRILVSAVEGKNLDTQVSAVPLLSEKRALGGKATAYVCRARTCERPTSDLKEFAEQLARVNPLFPDVTPAPLPVVSPAAGSLQ